MTLRTRRCVFYSFILIFIAVGAGVIFYSQGWRPVWQENKIAFQKTGAIFVEIFPKDAEIKINGKIFEDKSGLLKSGTFIDNFLPKNYKIEIKKDGYLAWQKNLFVKSGMVAETGKIILIPEKISPQPISISKNAGTFWEKENKFIFSSGGALYYSSQNEPVKLKGNGFAVWSEDGSKFITKDAANLIYYFYDANNISKATNLNSTFNNLTKTSISEITFHPADSNKLIIKAKNGALYILDLNRLVIETITQKIAISFAVKNPNILYISGNEIHSFNLLLKTDDLKFELSKELAGQKISEISSNGNAIFVLFQNSALYIFNQQNPTGVKIADSVKKSVVSPDNKKLAFWDSKDGLKIYFIEDYQTEIIKKPGDITTLSAYKELGIKNVFWYKDSRYLLVETAKNAVDFIEIDDRQPINKYTLSGNSSNSYYDQNSNRLYFIKENKIRFVEI
ncbi:MAG: hypothetical protein D4Q79_01470 [Spirochaetia bacterium]|nr:MAG: hypothetical protein D4Q79_01470 [Spirochaetia bacterium]